MRILFKKYWGFTLIEMMIVVAIALILSVIAGISLNSRLQVSRLEQAAQTLVSDLRYARSAAMFKNCPVRIVFCNDKSCSNISTSAVTGASGNFIGSGSTPALYYAILRESQKVDSSGATPCYNASAVGVSSPDSWTNWDFDRRPQSIPQGIVFTPIYSTFPAGNFDWTSTAHADASNSIYFNSSSGAFTVPVTNGTAASGDTVGFQLALQGCSPSTSSDDCLAFMITVGSGGAINLVKCSPAARAAGTDNCFP